MLTGSLPGGLEFPYISDHFEALTWVGAKGVRHASGAKIVALRLDQAMNKLNIILIFLRGVNIPGVNRLRI